VKRDPHLNTIEYKVTDFSSYITNYHQLNFYILLLLDQKKQKSRAAEKKAKNLSTRVK
jgi:hypothetical protein